MKSAPHAVHQQRQRGAATLVVVMVLFLVMALLAAYANRSLMFEQRISSSYYRASMAQEMAEGGIEWALAMLNGTGINGSCAAVSTGGTRFVDKYLNVSGADRIITSQVTTLTPLAADCARTDNGLVCRCPAPNARAAQPAAAASGVLVPSFGIAMGIDTRGSGPAGGSVLLTSYGCTDSSVDTCSSGTAANSSQKAVAAAVQSATVGLIPAVPSSPSAPLIVRGGLITAGAGGLGLHNTDARSSGLLAISGGHAPALNSGRLDSVPGTPPSQALRFDDLRLSEMTGSNGEKQFFRSFMGMVPSRYQNHPAARFVDCQAGAADCGPNLVNAYAAGQRMLLVRDGMALGSNVIIGTVAAPVLVVVYGDVVIHGPLQLNGMLVVLGDLAWVNAGAAASQITGMVVVQGDMHTDGQMDIVYQQSIADALHNRLGSFARVSGGWIDGDISY